MSVGIFTDKKIQPTDLEVEQAVGTRWSLWQELIHYLRETYPAREDFKFMYGKNYGWALRFRVQSQLLTSLFPAEGNFRAQVNLGPEGVQTTLGMGLGENVHRAIDAAIPYPEGRWLFITVDSPGDLEDVKKLLALRVKEKRLVKG